MHCWANFRYRTRFGRAYLWTGHCHSTIAFCVGGATNCCRFAMVLARLADSKLEFGVASAAAQRQGLLVIDPESIFENVGHLRQIFRRLNQCLFNVIGGSQRSVVARQRLFSDFRSDGARDLRSCWAFCSMSNNAELYVLISPHLFSANWSLCRPPR